MRGASLTIQSDIYSVGATLFYLLTGRAPFEAGDLMAMLAQVATEAPRSPRDFARTVPIGLAAVVQRCLAKDSNARPRSYTELSEKLRPFASASATIAPLRSRLAAAIIDLVLITFVFNLVSVSVRIIARDATATATAVLWPLLFVTIYFALTEGFGTASPGKWVFGLRISSVEGGSAGFLRGCFRAALFALAARAPFLISNGPIIDALLPVATFGPMQRAERAGQLVTILFALRQLGPLILFLPARRRNGFAGIHDLASGTRVIARARLVTESGASRTDFHQVQRERAKTGADHTLRRGPFVLVELLRSSAVESLWLGLDPALNRHVWIRDASLETPLSDAARRELARPGRLRWLAGRRTQDGTWEAFEAPSGRSLCDFADTPQPWRLVRRWLVDLVEELAGVFATDDCPCWHSIACG